jgi:hypothetical protein
VRDRGSTAFQTQYRQEFVAGFEQHVSLLRDTVTTEAEIKGNTAVFLVADSGGAAAVTRGVNGLIPARSDNLTQNSCTLSEWHDLVRKTGFNIFASQGNQRAIMQMTSMGGAEPQDRRPDRHGAEHRHGDDRLLGTIPDVSLFQNGRVKLSNASVPWDSRITLLCQPSFLAYMEQAPEFERGLRGSASLQGLRRERELARQADGVPLEELPDRRAPEPSGQGHLEREVVPVPQDRDRAGRGRLRAEDCRRLQRRAGLHLRAHLLLHGREAPAERRRRRDHHDGSAYAYKGPHLKYCVIRKSDKSIVHEGAASRVDANSWLLGYARTVGAKIAA